jgi:hypothetical protein
MPKFEPVKSRTPIGLAKMKITAYRCPCGHWNNLKSRKRNERMDEM